VKKGISDALRTEYRQVPDVVCRRLPTLAGRVFTLDSDFGMYRLDRARTVPLIAPF